jgi:hypothetical protein
MANNDYDDAVQQVQQQDESNTGNSSGSNRFILIDPLQFSTFLFIVLILFVFYLLLPRGIRKQYFYAHPKRHAWTARNPNSSSMNSNLTSSSRSMQQQHQQQRGNANTPIGLQVRHLSSEGHVRNIWRFLLRRSLCSPNCSLQNVLILINNEL